MLDHHPRISAGLSVPVNAADRAPDHAQGPADAPVTLVWYGDYECPYCARALPLVKRLQGAMAGRLRLVYRHFPQNNVHAHASAAAQAAEAAALQGKFWEMHDLLFEHQDDLGDVDFTHFALKLGLEVYRFSSDLVDGRLAAKVRRDHEGGVGSGVTGTPAFFINGRRYEGPLDYDALLAAATAATAG